MNAIARAGEQLVVVVAHPDDESFGCGSLIAAATAAGAQVTVICATRGEEGERVPDAATDSVPLGDLREGELRAAAAVLGAETVELLDLADSGFDGPLPDGSLCAVAVEDVARDVESRLARLQADVVLTIDGSDGHRDHKHMRAAVEAVFDRYAGPLRMVQACLSNSLMRRWVEEARASHPDTAYLDLDIEHLGRPDTELSPIDNSEFLSVREAAIACHRSQRSPYEGLSAELRQAFLTTDFVVTRTRA